MQIPESSTFDSGTFDQKVHLGVFMLFKDTVFVITEVEHIGYLDDQLQIFSCRLKYKFPQL